MAQIPRSSSLVENLNSRLRNYFTLHRHLGSTCLHLRRFFLNHRCFMRSRLVERIGKSQRVRAGEADCLPHNNTAYQDPTHNARVLLRVCLSPKTADSEPSPPIAWRSKRPYQCGAASYPPERT